MDNRLNVKFQAINDAYFELIASCQDENINLVNQKGEELITAVSTFLDANTKQDQSGILELFKYNEGLPTSPVTTG